VAHYLLVDTQSQLASKLQSTLVRPDVTRAQLIDHIECCGNYGFNAAMIAMAYIALARSILSGTNVKIATTICFGTGNESLKAKIALLQECSALGADEVDYEPHMTLFLSSEYDAFREESAMLINAAGAITLKAMLELGFIETIDEKKHAALLLEEAGVPWVKNASGGGPHPGQATPEDIRLLRETLHPKTKVKASGGIKTYAQAMSLINAGAELLGTSAAIAIIQGTEAEETDY
jgi:deoxyribose-phosphate aldolase